MGKEKLWGTWTLSEKETKEGRHIRGEFKAGAIPSIIVFGLLAIGIWVLFT